MLPPRASHPSAFQLDARSTMCGTKHHRLQQQRHLGDWAPVMPQQNRLENCHQRAPIRAKKSICP